MLDHHYLHSCYNCPVSDVLAKLRQASLSHTGPLYKRFFLVKPFLANIVALTSLGS